MQLGFVIDHDRCIGCHACTVACKSENDVPVGSFRTWVKYTESGEFPEVKRSFAVLRCNQCTDAPCVEICPVSALEKRSSDGIVDIDPDMCIGCKACMQGCPYDALYIHPDKGTAQKCHFCAHRTEVGLAPACAVVCPTEAIIPGDFHDPASVVSRLKATGELSARKTEAGTNPNVWYREAAPAGLDPSLTNTTGGSIWANSVPGVQADAQLFEAMEAKARHEARLEQALGARTVYDVAHKPLWGKGITGYLFFKSLAAGIFLAGASLLAPWSAPEFVPPALALGIPSLALLFLTVTLVLLVADLKRPERFLRILLKPNWNSWLAKGSYILLADSLLLSAWIGLAVFDVELPVLLGWVLIGTTALMSALSAAYTGWLFAQAKGRVLWMKRGYAGHLLVQAVLAGSAALVVVAPLLGADAAGLESLATTLLVAVAVHAVLTFLEGHMSPPGRGPEYHRAARLVTHGPFAALHWGMGVAVGMALPAALLMAHDLLGGGEWTHVVAGLAALVGLWFEKDIFVRAGQALPIS